MGLFFHNSELWEQAYDDATYFKQEQQYMAMGSVYADALVMAVNGGVPEGSLIPHPHIPNLPPIVIPKKVDVAADIFAGVLYGITEQDNLPKLNECFYDLDQFVYDFLHGYNWIASRKIAGLIDGFMLLLETIIYIPQDAMDCIAAKADIGGLKQFLGRFEHPKDLKPVIQHNIKRHLAQLTIHLNKARKNLAQKQWTMLGEQVGEMLVIVTEPIPTDESDVWFTIEITDEELL